MNNDTHDKTRSKSAGPQSNGKTIELPALEHRMDLDVQIFDTDCFGVMWHGSYIKWLELGRVRLMETRGIRLSRPDEPEGYIYPVVDQHLRFKAPGPYQDKLTLTTTLRIEGFRLVFEQAFFSHRQQKNTLEATTVVMICDMNWKLQRRVPQELMGKLLA